MCNVRVRFVRSSLVTAVTQLTLHSPGSFAIIGTQKHPSVQLWSVDIRTGLSPPHAAPQAADRLCATSVSL